MRISKSPPQPEVTVYRGKKKDEYIMVATKPIELAVLKFFNGKWTTPSGSTHRTHKEAMRHVLYKTEHKELLDSIVDNEELKQTKKAIPSKKAANEDNEPLVFENKKQMLEHLLNQEGVVEMLMEKLDTVAATPKVRNLKGKQVSNANS